MESKSILKNLVGQEYKNLQVSQVRHPGYEFLYLVLQVGIRTVRGLLRIRHENLKQALYVQYSMLEKSKLIQYYHFTITTRNSRVHREIVYNFLGRIQT